MAPLGDFVSWPLRLCKMPCICTHAYVFRARPSSCWERWQGYLHCCVTIHQSPAPRQPCRLATRARFTKGRLHPGAKGGKKKTEEKRKRAGRTSPTSSFSPFWFSSARLCGVTQRPPSLPSNLETPL